MVWAPKFKTTSRSRLRDNLIAYWLTKEVEAYAWAKSELGQAASPVLTPLTNFYTSAVGRALTTFPHGMVVSATTREVNLDLGGDTCEALRHTFLFEFEIAGTDAAAITAEAEARVTAFDSVARNIPKATLLSGVGKAAGGILRIPSVDPDVLRGRPASGQTGEWMKAPQVTVQVDLIEGI